MVDSNVSPTDGPPGPRKGRLQERAIGFLVVEGIALAIAVAMPLTPSKTGSTWSPAHWFSAEPSYLEKVLASFVLVNVVLLLLGLVALVVSKRQPERQE